MQYKKEILNRVPLNINNTYVVADFDRTITKEDSKTSWSILSNTKLLPDSYITERQKLFEEYRPIEIDNKMPYNFRQNKMKEWFEKHINLFIKYGLKEDVVIKASINPEMMEFREGVKEFLRFLYKNNIPLIIISAGVGNFIECFLKLNNCCFSNIYISSNIIKFKDRIAIGVENEIIHSLNKSEAFLPKEVKDKLKDRNEIILFGDNIGDIDMVEKEKLENTIKIGFLTDDTKGLKHEFEKSFDIICTSEDSYTDIKELLF